MTAGRRVLGIDIGSRTTKTVELEDGRVTTCDIFDTTHTSIDRVRSLAESRRFAAVVATGYGRYLATAHLGCRVITEISACALGARRLRPDCGLVIDIGGQDAKAIELGGDGAFTRFEMNDRCAAGTGRFLEVMAGVLGYTLEEFGGQALAADRPAAVSSMCTVFAESEVISLLAAGEDRRRVALGLHESIADRIWPLAARLEVRGEAVFAGGVALNRCLVELLSRKIGRPLVVPDKPQLVSALGAALAAAKQ
jgi:(R)-2-hydroxyacyl-CoA dehydratese activating ATPase